MTCCLQMLDLQQRLYQAEQASASHVANAEQLQQVSGHCLSGCMVLGSSVAYVMAPGSQSVASNGWSQGACLHNASGQTASAHLAC